MWNRSKDDDLSAQPAMNPAATSQVSKEGIPMSTPGRASEPHYESTRTAILGKSVSVKGQIFSREDLTLDGEVEGTVELQEHRLTIGPNGNVRASVKARELVVVGTLYGNVETTDRIEIRKEAKLIGDIKTARIVIEDGAYFKGNIDIVRPEPARAAPASSPKPPAVAAAAPGPVLATGGPDTKLRKG